MALPDAGGCASGYFVTEVLDLLDCDPVQSGTVQAIDENGVPLPGSVTLAADGSFVLCNPGTGPYTPYITAPGYETEYFGELQAGAHYVQEYTAMVSTSSLTALASFFPGGFDGAQGAIIATIGHNAVCPSPTGWSVWLTDVDGGAIDGGYRVVYLGASQLPDPTATATTDQGIAVLYDIDLSATSYFGVGASNPDAGACPASAESGIFTGRLYVTANAVSSANFFVP
jgi:hypothetical protein